TAEAVKVQLEKAGCDKVEICETPGNPIVYGEKIIDKNLPTVLVYGHYDVQPPDPLDLWDSLPFEPDMKNTDIHPEGAIFASGSCHYKRRIFIQANALEYMTKTNQLACNVRFMIVGEEEVWSVILVWSVARNKEKLPNDLIFISYT